MPIISYEKMKDATFYGVKFTPDEFRQGALDLTPDEAIARGLCPETGVPLASLNIQDHIARLWPKARSDDAIKRIDLLTKWETDNAKPAAPATPPSA